MVALPAGYVILPWALAADRCLPDTQRLTYELVLSLAWGYNHRHTPPLRRAELARLRGLSLRAVDEHLRALRRSGYLRDMPGRTGKALVLIPVHLVAPHGLGDQGSGAGDQSDTAPQHPAADPSPARQHPAGNPPPTPHQLAADPCPARQHPAGDPSPTSPPPAPPPLRPVAGPAEPGGDASSESVVSCSQDKSKEQLLTTVRALTAAGVYPGVARRLAPLEWVTPEVVAAWARALRASSRVRNPGAVLAALLRRADTCLPPPDPPEGRVATQFAVDDSLAVDDAQGPEVDGPLANPQGSPRDESRSPLSPDPSPRPESPASDAEAPFPFWEPIAALVRERVGAQRVDHWLGDAYVFSWTDDTLVVAAHSAQAADWLANVLYRPLQRAAEEVLRTRVRLRFVVGAKNASGG